MTAPRSMRAAAAAAGLAAFAAYLATLAPSIAIGDSGELAAAAHSFGVAHTTGYPLATMLGGMAARVPLGSPAWRLNALSALLAAAGVALFALFLRRLMDAVDGDPPPAGPSRASAERASADRLLAATGGALLLGFSRVYWSAALTTDVFALQALLVILLLYAAVPLFLGPRGAAPRPRAWRLFAVALGLALSHHLSTLALLPAFIALFLARYRGPGLLRRVLRPLPWAAAGLLPLAYLPLRALADPALNQGDPSTPAAFLQHAGGAQLFAWMFTGTDVFLLQLRRLGELCAADPLPAALGLAGFVFLLRRSRAAAWLLALAFAGAVLWAANDAVLDIDRHFLAACIAAAAAAAFTLRRVLEWFVRSPVVPALAIAACVGAEAFLSAGAVSERGNTVAEDYARNVLGSLAPRAVIFSDEWPIFTAPALYLQLACGERGDVLVIDTRQLRRPWYVRQLLRRQGALLAGAAADAEAYTAAYDRDPRADAAELAALQQRLIASLAASAADARPVYTTIGMATRLFPAMSAVPSGMAMRLYRVRDVPGPASVPRFRYRAAPRVDDATAAVVGRYFRAYAVAGNRLWQEGRREEADRCFALASTFPQFRPGERWKAWQQLAPRLSAIY